MSVIEKAISQMESWADDPAHGYDQRYRWGEYGDFDCSAAVIQAWENAGVPVKSNGATYTGNMLAVFKRCGFEDVTSKINLSTGSGLVRGDVLLNVTHHTAMYCGNGYEVEASGNEKGGITGGKPGDRPFPPAPAQGSATADSGRGADRPAQAPLRERSAPHRTDSVLQMTLP